MTSLPSRYVAPSLKQFTEQYLPLISSLVTLETHTDTTSPTKARTSVYLNADNYLIDANGSIIDVSNKKHGLLSISNNGKIYLGTLVTDWKAPIASDYKDSKNIALEQQKIFNSMITGTFDEKAFITGAMPLVIDLNIRTLCSHAVIMHKSSENIINIGFWGRDDQFYPILPQILATVARRSEDVLDDMLSSRHLALRSARYLHDPPGYDYTRPDGKYLIKNVPHFEYYIEIYRGGACIISLSKSEKKLLLKCYDYGIASFYILKRDGTTVKHSFNNIPSYDLIETYNKSGVLVERKSSIKDNLQGSYYGYKEEGGICHILELNYVDSFIDGAFKLVVKNITPAVSGQHINIVQTGTISGEYMIEVPEELWENQGESLEDQILRGTETFLRGKFQQVTPCYNKL